MKKLIFFLTLLPALVSAQPGSGLMDPRWIGWIPDSSGNYVVRWNPATFTTEWMPYEPIGTNDSTFISGDSICVIDMGDTICVANDSVYITMDSLCYIVDGDTTCVAFNGALSQTNIYNTSDTITASENRVVTIPSTSTLSFLEQGSNYFMKMYPGGDSIGVMKKLRLSAPILDQNGSAGTANHVLINDGFGGVQWGSVASVYEVKLSDLLPAALSHTIDNTDQPQEWQWSGLSGNALKLSSTSTAAGAGSVQRLFESSLSGANAGAARITYAGYFSNSHTGTNCVNYGLYGNASGGTNTNFGVFGNASATGSANAFGVYGKTTHTVGAGVQGESTVGVGLSGLVTTGVPLKLQDNTTTTNAVESVIEINHFTSGTAANGFGGSIEFTTETSTSTGVSNTLSSLWTNATHASRSSRFSISGVNATVTNDIIYFDGNKSTVFNGRYQGKKGADVASTTSLTLGYDGNLFHITGTTQINAITTTDWQAGSEVTLIFDGSLTVKNNTAGGAGTAVILLASGADFGATANDVLKLVYDGTSWFEVSRSAN